MLKQVRDLPLVSISLLNYNGIKYTKKCLETLSKVKYKNLEIILVDNGSVDGCVEFVKKKYPKVKIIANKKNVGFCHGNNQAFNISKGKYILFLNNDTEVTPGFLTPLVEAMEQDENVGIVQPKISKLREKEKLDACCSFYTNTGFLYHYGYAQNKKIGKYNEILPFYSAKGACFLVRSEIIKKIGLFDEAYIAYFEETDFCHRVLLSGKKILYQPESEIFHLGGADNKQNTQRSVQFNSYKNRIRTYIKNFSTLELIKMLPIHIIVCIGIATVYVFMGKKNVSFAILSAILWNVVHISETIKKRKLVQNKFRKIKDKEYLKYVKINPPISYYKHFLLHPEDKYSDKKIPVFD